MAWLGGSWSVKVDFHSKLRGMLDLGDAGIAVSRVGKVCKNSTMARL